MIFVIYCFFKLLLLKETSGIPQEYQIGGGADLGPNCLQSYQQTTRVGEGIFTTCDFQQCGISTSLYSDVPVQSPLSLETPNDVQ